MFIEGKYTGKVLLSEETFDYLKKCSKVALFSSIQFIDHLPKIKEQLKEAGLMVVNSKPDRAHVDNQLLGCDVYHGSLKLDEEVDCYLYIGDGRFHPLALVHASDVDVVCFNPLENKMTVLDKKDIEKIEKRKKGSLVKFHSSENIGVIVTIKPGQEQLNSGLKLEEKYPNKKFYYFIDNDISFGQLENFPFIDVWVNTACPRIGLDDIEMFRKGVVNVMDVL